MWWDPSMKCIEWKSINHCTHMTYKVCLYEWNFHWQIQNSLYLRNILLVSCCCSDWYILVCVHWGQMSFFWFNDFKPIEDTVTTAGELTATADKQMIRMQNDLLMMTCRNLTINDTPGKVPDNPDPPDNPLKYSSTLGKANFRKHGHSGDATLLPKTLTDIRFDQWGASSSFAQLKAANE